MILDPTVIPASDRSILVQFGDEISEDLHYQVFLFTQGLLASSHQAISNISPGYSSVLVRLHHKTTLAQGMDTIEDVLKEEHPGDTIPQRTVEIPVCYEDEFGPDLGRVLKHTGYDKEELIERHTSGIYLVYFLGFSAGFPYILPDYVFNSSSIFINSHPSFLPYYIACILSAIQFLLLVYSYF